MCSRLAETALAPRNRETDIPRTLPLQTAGYQSWTDAETVVRFAAAVLTGRRGSGSKRRIRSASPLSRMPRVDKRHNVPSERLHPRQPCEETARLAWKARYSEPQ